jgi:hypothetical protein
MKKIQIYDTTLRDGSQGEDIEWHDVPRPASGSLGKRILRQSELISRGVCARCAPRHASRSVS